ncbi:hypothetical protein D9613_003988 [Agrocybe pediades]|uniref:Uncharacterized protein n=1 Tax=Agrocybe pediades TaxID=84607 RepID=A0A8H4VJ25_9AGAR|nr:hypothetical protein D9613_003988 [Agrocybe pediades]
MEPVIIVNGFAFCQKHGRELCGKCDVDLRPRNNDRIRDSLKIFSYELDARRMFNVYALGAVKAGVNEASYKCKDHGKVDCEKGCQGCRLVDAAEKDKAEFHGQYDLIQRLTVRSS